MTVVHLNEYRDHLTRVGGDRRSDAEQIEEAIIALARVIGLTAIEANLSREYAPVMVHLVKARRALREAYGKPVTS